VGVTGVLIFDRVGTTHFAGTAGSLRSDGSSGYAYQQYIGLQASRQAGSG